MNMSTFLLPAILILLCSGCNNTDADINEGGSVAESWSWKSPQKLPLTLTGDVTTFTGLPDDVRSIDGFGTYAAFEFPSGITSNGSNLYVIDNMSKTIRKVVIATGEVTTIAGSPGISAHTNGFGTDARFVDPWTATTNANSLFIIDRSNTIRVMNLATTEVTTLAGLSGSSGSTDGFGTLARFNDPLGITTDGENLYVADTGNSRIRKIVIATGEVSTLAGGISGAIDGAGVSARFNAPSGIVTDGSYLYVSDSGSNTIRQIDIMTKVVRTIAGDASRVAGHVDGIGRFARLNDPLGITADSSSLYVLSSTGCTLRKIVKATGAVSTIAGLNNSCSVLDGTGGAARLEYPMNISTDGKSLYFVENNVVRKAD